MVNLIDQPTRWNIAHTHFSQVFFQLFAQGGGGGGGKHIFVYKACGKLGRSGGMLPGEILILDLLLDAIW